MGATGSQEKWVESLKQVARFVKIENGHLIVKFDEIGVLSFGQKIPNALPTTGFEHFTLNVLSTVASGLTDVSQNLLRPPPTLTGEEYDVLARVLLGFQAVKAITPSIKQVVAYIPYYIDKAREDGDLPVTLEHISDATMETAHKQPKQRNILFSGRRDGPADGIEYQKCVLT